MNDERLSASEELEISKEELRSLCEELKTVNVQLRNKVADLEIANNDFANLLNCTDIAIILLDDQFQIKRFTAPATRLFHLVSTDIGRLISDIMPRYPDSTLQQDIELVLRTLTPLQKQVQTQTQTQDGCTWNRRITPYFTADNRVEGVVLTFTDVTQIRQASDRVQQLAAVLQDLNDAIVVHDFDGKMIAWNRGAEAMFGYSESEALQMNCLQIIADETHEQIRAYREQLRRDERVTSWEARRRTKDGRILDVWVTATALKDEAGRLIAIAKTERDISEQKRAEAALRYSESLYRAIGESIDYGVWVCAPDGRNIYASESFLKLVGLTQEQCSNFGWGDVLHPDDSARTIAAWKECVRTGDKWDIEHRFRGVDGEWHHVLARGVPIKDERGQVLCWAGINLDISDFKRVEEELRKSENKLQLFVEHAPAAIAMFDRGMHYLAASRRWLLDYRLTENIIGRSHYDVFPEIMEPWKEVHRRALAGEVQKSDGERFERADGAIHWIKWEVLPWYAKGATVGGIMIASEDITDRKRTEQALQEINASLEQQVADRTRTIREREARLGAILNSAADAIITIDSKGIIQSVNAVTERLFGFTAREMIGENVKILMPSPFRDEHDRYLENYERTGVGKIIGVSREAVAQRKDGSTFPMELTVSEVDHLHIFTGILRDITRRKELEREVVEIASLEQRRIGEDLHDSVGQELTALNLQIRDLAEILHSDPSSAPKLVELMAQGLRCCQTELRAVMRGLLPVAVDSEGLMAALTDLADRVQQEGKANCTFACPESVAVADNLTATHLYLIAQEAVHNAIKHARPGNIHVSLHVNDRLTLSVRDDGIGMPAEPTENHGGLGLRIMRNRAAIIGAILTIRPVEPSGTVVTCALVRKYDDTKNDPKAIPDTDRR